MKPAISLLTPTFKRPDLLQRCLNKLGAAIPESQEAFELIVSDDSNLEENKKLVQAFEKNWRGKCMYMGQPEPLGQQRNFNALLEQADGEFIQFIHDDDFLLPNSGSVLFEASRQHSDSPMINKFGIEVVKMDESRIRREAPASQRELSPSLALQSMLSDSSYIRFPSIFTTKKAYKECGFFDRNWDYLADQALWFEMASRYGIREHPACTVAYTIHGLAGTSTMFTKQFVVKLEKLLRIYAPKTGLESPKQQALLAKFLWKFCLAGFWRSLKAKDFSKAADAAALVALLDQWGLSCPRKWLPLSLAARSTALVYNRTLNKP